MVRLDAVNINAIAYEDPIHIFLNIIKPNAPDTIVGEAVSKTYRPRRPFNINNTFLAENIAQKNGMGKFCCHHNIPGNNLRLFILAMIYGSRSQDLTKSQREYWKKILKYYCYSIVDLPNRKLLLSKENRYFPMEALECKDEDIFSTYTNDGFVQQLIAEFTGEKPIRLLRDDGFCRAIFSSMFWVEWNLVIGPLPKDREADPGAYYDCFVGVDVGRRFTYKTEQVHALNKTLRKNQVIGDRPWKDITIDLAENKLEIITRYVFELAKIAITWPKKEARPISPHRAGSIFSPRTSPEGERVWRKKVGHKPLKFAVTNPRRKLKHPTPFR